MKKSFVKGMVVGVIITAVVSVGIHFGLNHMETSGDTSVSAQTSKKLNYLQKIIDNYYLEDTDKTKLEDGVYKGLLEGLGDPYSVYYTADEYKELQESTSGSYCGIGVVVSQNVDTGVVTAIRVFDGAPGDKAGIKADDILYKVEGREITGKDLNEVVSKIKGKKGTKVNVTVYRPSEKKYIDIEIVRDEVDIPTVEHKMLDNNIGYVEILEFDEVTYKQFSEAMKDLKKQGMKSVIFDVRDNPGGMYDIVVKMLDDLLPEGTIVYTEDKNGKKEVQKSDSKCLNMPMAVLQNGNSASAAEIFAGAIKDYEVGTIVGTKSFGKGIVQSIMPLNDGSAIKLTIQKYFTPKGVNIHKKGIEPDVEVENDVNSKNDEQLEKAISILSKNK